MRQYKEAAPTIPVNYFRSWSSGHSQCYAQQHGGVLESLDPAAQEAPRRKPRALVFLFEAA